MAGGKPVIPASLLLGDEARPRIPASALLGDDARPKIPASLLLGDRPDLDKVAQAGDLAAEALPGADPVYTRAAAYAAQGLPPEERVGEMAKIRGQGNANLALREHTGAAVGILAAAGAPESDYSRTKIALEKARAMGSSLDEAARATLGDSTVEAGADALKAIAKPIASGGRTFFKALDVPAHAVRALTMPGGGYFDWKDTANSSQWHDAIEKAADADRERGDISVPRALDTVRRGIGETAGAALALPLAAAGQGFDYLAGRGTSEDRFRQDFGGVQKAVGRFGLSMLTDPLTFVSPSEIVNQPAVKGALSGGWDALRNAGPVGKGAASAAAIGARALGARISPQRALFDPALKEGYAAQLVGRGAGAASERALIEDVKQNVAPLARGQKPEDLKQLVENTLDPHYLGPTDPSILNGTVHTTGVDVPRSGKTIEVVPGPAHASISNLTPEQQRFVDEYFRSQGRQFARNAAAGLELGANENPLAAADYAKAQWAKIGEGPLPPAYTPRIIGRNETGAEHALANAEAGRIGGTSRADVAGVEGGGVPIGSYGDGWNRFGKPETDPWTIYARQAKRDANRVAVATTQDELVRRGLAQPLKARQAAEGADIGSALNPSIAKFTRGGTEYAVDADVWNEAMRPFLNKDMNSFLGWARGTTAGKAITSTPVGRALYGGAEWLSHGPMSAMKTGATVWRPGYHIRNRIEDAMQGAAAGMGAGDLGWAYKAFKPGAAESLESPLYGALAPEQVLEEARRRTLSAGGLNLDLHGGHAADALERVANPEPGALGRMKNAASDVWRAPAKLNENWRDRVELATFGARLRAGDTYDEAARRTLGALIDYGNRGTTTQAARWAAPYATYLMKAPAMAATSAFHSPAAVMATPRFYDAMLGDQAPGDLPDSLREKGYVAPLPPRAAQIQNDVLRLLGNASRPFGAPAAPGLSPGVQPFIRPPEPFFSGVAPFEQALLGNVDPLISETYQHARLPLEALTGRNAITKQDMAPVKEWNLFPAGMPGIHRSLQAKSDQAPGLLTQYAAPYVPAVGSPLGLWALNQLWRGMAGPEQGGAASYWGLYRPRARDTANNDALALQSMLTGVSTGELRPADIASVPAQRSGVERANKVLSDALKARKAARVQENLRRR